MADQNLILYIKNEDGTSFHNIRLNKFAYTTTVMAFNSKIEGEFYYKDNRLSFTLAEYVEYKGMKYTLKNPPVVIKKGMTSDNSELKGMTKYTCTFFHEEVELYNIPFVDNRTAKRTFSWIGNLSSFLGLMNESLKGTKWKAEIQPGFGVSNKLSEVITFNNQFITNACKVAYETFKVPYVIDGYKILFGRPSNEILNNDGRPYAFRLGQGLGLRNNDVTPKNNKVITRIAGYGSELNLPYGYPIIKNADGNIVEHPYTRDRLMPSIYIETLRRKVLINSNTQLVDYYDADDSFPTPLNPLAPVFHIQEFNDIKPSIENMTYNGNPIDTFYRVLTPEGGWDDYIDPETGAVRQSYFDVELYPLGFDIYAQAAVTGAMTFSMRSGDTLGANYEVGVDWEDVKRNFYITDEEGKVIFAPYGEQRDFEKYPDSTDEIITLKLTKDLDTFGTLIPNKFQYPSGGDKFVLLHIEMPQSYIDAAQKKLDAAMMQYMKENNMPLYDYPLEFDEYFLSTHPEIVDQIKTNSIIRFIYGDEVMLLSVKEISIKYGSDPLPKYNITLTDEVSIVLNQIGQIADGLSKLGSQVAALQALYGVDVYAELNKKLSKVSDDTSTGKITSTKAFQVGQFVTGTTGGLFNVDNLGKSHLELDYLTVRMKAMFRELEIIKTSVAGGRLMVTPGGAIECTKVEVYDSYYRCYFLADNGGEKIENKFKQGDMAMSESFNIKPGVYENVSNHYYWRLVVNTGDDFIDLSINDADTVKEFKSDIPKVGDVICQLGNRTDTTRQNALIMSAVDTYSPSLTFYCGINDYSYLDKEYIEYGVDKTTNLAYMNIYGNSYTGTRDKSAYIKYDTKTGVEIKGTLITKSGTNVEDALSGFQDQIDGVKETFYGEYSPTLTNYPANEWVSEKDKKRHEGDVFTNIQAYIDDTTTPDAGKSWRWVQTDGVWGWIQIADSDTSKAYFEAAKAAKAAKEAAEAANKANTTVDSLKNFTDKAFEDGIIDRSEATAIGKYLNNIISIQNDVTESYSKVYANPLLSGPVKTDLKTAYDGFNTATSDLIATINAVVTEGIADSKAVAAVDSKYAIFNTKYGDFIGYLNAANKFIQDKINDNAANALKAAEQAQAAAEEVAKSVTTLSGTVDSLKNFTDDAFKDGIIDRGEAAAIEKYINSINATKGEADATYNKLYANNYLVGSAKSGLKTAYDKLVSSVSVLIDSIRETITDGVAEPEEKVIVDAKFALYSEALADFSTAVETANKSIQDTLKGYSDAAQKAADNAQEDANSAKNRLDNWAADNVISPTEKQGIKDEIARIDADKDNIVIGYNLYTLGTPTAYNNAYTAYRAVLVSLSASTPEIIPIPSDFSTKQTAYYTQRTAALNAIAKATKDSIAEVGKDMADYEYLKKAWGENTSVEGGLLFTSLAQFGSTINNVFTVKSGINGISLNDKPGGGIAAWYGGAMKDRADYTEANMPSDVATSLIRMDGSGYLAGGKVWWGLDGKFHADPLSFLIEEKDVGSYLRLFQIVYKGSNKTDINYMIPQYPMQTLKVADYIEIGTSGYRIGVDPTNKAIKVYAEDGTGVGFYATGFVSAKGVSSSGGSGGGGLIKSVYRYTDLGKSFNDSDSNNTFNAYTINKLAERIGSLESGGGGGSVDGIILNGVTYSPNADTKLITLPNYPSIPSSLKNPYSITFTGYQSKTYDGSSAVSVAIPTTLPASDVYAWAKAANKPSYSWDEITGTLTVQWDNVRGRPGWVQSASKPQYAFSEIINPPTTLAGYGITDAVTLNTTQTITNTKTFTAEQRFNIRSIYFQNSTVGGSANGLFLRKNGWGVVKAGIGFFTAADGDPSMYIGWGESPWLGEQNFHVSSSVIQYKGNNILHQGNYSTYLDNRYYTETEADSRFVNVSGDTMSGNLNFTNNQFIYFNDNTNFAIGSNGSIGTFLQYSSNVLNVTSQDVYFNTNQVWHAGNDGLSSALEAGKSGKLHIWDVREVDRLPNYFDDKTLTAFFNYAGMPTTDWWSGIVVSGWTNPGYVQWQLAGYSSSGAAGEHSLCYREGKGSTWQPWKALAFTTDNVASATKLQTAREINGTAFDGTANITTVNWGYTRTLSLSGNASGSVSINGGSNIALSVSNNYASAAGKLNTARTLWGRSFDGTGNVSGDMSSVGTILSSANNTKRIGSASNQWEGVYAGWVSGGDGRDLILAANNANKVWILTNGNVGIGFSPSSTYKLHVNGNIRANGVLSCGEDIDDQYGYVNVTRQKNINACCFSFIAAGTFARGIGYTTGGNIWIGTPNTSKQLSSAWLTVASSGITSIGDVKANNGYLTSVSNGKTISIGSQNDSYCHYNTTAPQHWFNTAISINGNIYSHNGARQIGELTNPFGTIYMNNWFKSIGDTGWYSETYKGGIYMIDTNYVRVYNGKRFNVSNTENTDFSTVTAISTSGGIFAIKNITTNANMFAKGAVTAKQTSDMRLKEKFDYRIDYRKRLLALGDVVDFSYNDIALRRSEGAADRLRHTSVLYQKAMNAGITGLCYELSEDGYGSINPICPDLIFTIVGAVQKNIKIIDSLRNEIKNLKKKVENLERLLVNGK